MNVWFLRLCQLHTRSYIQHSLQQADYLVQVVVSNLSNQFQSLVNTHVISYFSSPGTQKEKKPRNRCPSTCFGLLTLSAFLLFKHQGQAFHLSSFIEQCRLWKMPAKTLWWTLKTAVDKCLVSKNKKNIAELLHLCRFTCRGLERKHEKITISPRGYFQPLSSSVPFLFACFFFPDILLLLL